jgi:hypothetical protein
MVLGTAIRCSQCQQPITPGERFVSFKIPGKETYQFFHCRFRARDCWEGHLTKDRVRLRVDGTCVPHLVGIQGVISAATSIFREE